MKDGSLPASICWAHILPHYAKSSVQLCTSFLLDPDKEKKNYRVMTMKDEWL